MRNRFGPLAKGALRGRAAGRRPWDSVLDWTVVRVDRLTNQTGPCRTAYGQTVRPGVFALRADVAHHLLRVLEQPETVNRASESPTSKEKPTTTNRDVVDPIDREEMNRDRGDFPGLGFDPAPGDPEALTSSAEAASQAAALFDDRAHTVRSLSSLSWMGKAAEAFRASVKDLPGDLERAAAAHGVAAQALLEFAQGLTERQRRVVELETRAAELRRNHLAAVAEVNRVAVAHAAAGSAELARLGEQYRGARSRADEVGADLEAVLRAARSVRDDHGAAAAFAAGRIRGSGEPPYREPGWRSRAWNSVTSWIKDNSDALKRFSGVLKGVSAALGVASLVPGLQLLAPLAALAGGAALVIDGALVLAGEGSWKSLALDAALTVLPTGPVLRTAHRIPGVSRGLEAVGEAIAAGRGGRAADTLATGPDLAAAARGGDDVPASVTAGDVLDGRALARPVPDGSARAIYDDRANYHPWDARFSSDDLGRLWERDYAAVGNVNRDRFVAEIQSGTPVPAGQPSYTNNCTPCVVATARALDGTVREAPPSVGLGIFHIMDALGIRSSDVATCRSYNDLVRKMLQLGDGSRGVVQIMRGKAAHVFNVVHDHNGVVFLDGQIGSFGRLRRDVDVIRLLVFRRGRS
jgi:Papain fold toxin 1, glutamine deamidase